MARTASFPRLKKLTALCKRLTSSTSGRIVGLVTVLGGTAALVVNLGTLFPSPPSLDVIDVSVQRTGEAPIVEVSVRNTGKRPGLAFRANFRVDGKWPLVRPPVAMHVPPSKQYDVALDPKKDPPYVRQVVIAHEIKPTELDRIGFRFASEPPTPHEVVYEIAFWLDYEAGHTTKERRVVIALPDLSDRSPGISTRSAPRRYRSSGRTPT